MGDEARKSILLSRMHYLSHRNEHLEAYVKDKDEFSAGEDGEDSATAMC